MTYSNNTRVAKLFDYSCGCSIRIIRGKIDRVNFCKMHWDECNDMEINESDIGSMIESL